MQRLSVKVVDANPGRKRYLSINLSGRQVFLTAFVLCTLRTKSKRTTNNIQRNLTPQKSTETKFLTYPGLA